MCQNQKISPEARDNARALSLPQVVAVSTEDGTMELDADTQGEYIEVLKFRIEKASELVGSYIGLAEEWQSNVNAALILFEAAYDGKLTQQQIEDIEQIDQDNQLL